MNKYEYTIGPYFFEGENQAVTNSSEYVLEHASEFFLLALEEHDGIDVENV